MMKFTALKFSFGFSLLVHGAIFSAVFTVQHRDTAPVLDAGEGTVMEVLIERVIATKADAVMAQPAATTSVAERGPMLEPEEVADDMFENSEVVAISVEDSNSKIETTSAADLNRAAAESAELPRPVTGSLAATCTPGTQPNYSFNPKPIYPKEARRNRQEGLVVLGVTITEQGMPAAIELIESSGYKLLDEAAAAAVRCWRFTPARTGIGRTACRVAIPIRFKLSG